MSDERNEEGGMRVIDKRRFKLDDSGKVVEQPEASQYHEEKAVPTAAPAAPTAESAPAPEAAVPPGIAAPEPEEAAPSAAGTNHAGPSTASQDPIEDAGIPFMDFIRQQAYLAMIYLGQQPNPSTGLVQAQPEGVRDVVDLLITLRGRTRGNLTVEEAASMDDLIRQLQLAYLQATGGVPDPLAGAPEKGH